MTARPAWTRTHLPARATTWWQDNRADVERAAQHFADHDDTAEET